MKEGCVVRDRWHVWAKGEQVLLFMSTYLFGGLGEEGLSEASTLRGLAITGTVRGRA